MSYIYTSDFCIRLVFTPAPLRPGGPERQPTLWHSSHIVPSPRCLLLKVTQSKLGQSSQVKQKRRGPIAVETGLYSVCLLCLTAQPHHTAPTLSLPLCISCLFITSYQPLTPPPSLDKHTRIQLPNIRYRGPRWHCSAKACCTNQRKATGRRD